MVFNGDKVMIEDIYIKVRQEDGSMELEKTQVRYYDVYFLIKDEKVIYIGFSENVYNRVKSHRVDKDFDSFCVVYSVEDKKEARSVEKLLIMIISNFPNSNLINSTRLYPLNNVDIKSISDIDILMKRKTPLMPLISYLK